MMECNFEELEEYKGIESIEYVIKHIHWLRIKAIEVMIKLAVKLLPCHLKRIYQFIE